MLSHPVPPRGKEGIAVTEQELVARAKAGDQSAFEQLVLDNQKRIYTLCMRMTGDPGDGEDLAQEAFLHAWRGLPSFQGDSSFSTWVYRLASNVCLDFLRKRKRRQNVEGGPSVDDQDSGWTEPSDPVQDPEGALLRQEVQRAVEQGLAALPDHHRQVLVMRALSGMTYQEISQVLEVDLGTVKSRIARARLALKNYLQQDGNLFSQPPSNLSKK